MTTADLPAHEPSVDPISLGLGRAIRSARQAAEMSMRTRSALIRAASWSATFVVAEKKI